MNVVTGGPLEEAQAALAAGRWSAAVEAFATSPDHDQDADAQFGLGVARFWLGETQEALRCWERAYVRYRRTDQPGPAVLAAVYLCLAYRMSMGNDAAARGWLGRAARAVAEHGLTGLRPWVLLCRAHVANDTGQPKAAERWARQASDLARAEADVDLELCALGELGAALIEQGSVDEGTALLDEAMAGALAGEGRDRDAIVLISCRSIAASSRGGDIQRAMQWIRAADDFYRRNGSPHLYTTCRIQYGGILFATGQWALAEVELDAAVQMGGGSEPTLRAEALARLAEIRLAQGRLDEALRLLAGLEDHPAAILPLASIRIVSGEPAVAVALLRRRLGELHAVSLEAAAANEALVEAELATGAAEQATLRARQLAGQARRSNSALVAARGERAVGRAMLATGRGSTAVEHLERALARFARLEMPFEVARTRVLLAQACAAGEPATAIAEARAALVTFDRLGAMREADAAAAMIRSLGARASRGGPAATGLLTRRELDVLALLGEGLSNRQIGDRLFITRKTVEHHVASILAKAGLSGRGEAAAFAVRQLERDPARK